MSTDLTRYVATINVPGYLPMSNDEYRFETPEGAWAFLADERDSALSESDDDGEEVTHMWLRRLAGDPEYARRFTPDLGTWAMVDSRTLCGSVTGPTPGSDGKHDLGLAYSVERDDTLTELADHAVRGYCETMLWCGAIDATTGERIEGAHLDYAPVALSDFSADAQTQISDDVYDMIASCEDDFREYVERDTHGTFRTAGQFGHDFYLTRNGHGAGFWDRGLGDLGDRLTAMSEPYGDMSAYVTDGGPIEVQP